MDAKTYLFEFFSVGKLIKNHGAIYFFGNQMGTSEGKQDQKWYIDAIPDS